MPPPLYRQEALAGVTGPDQLDEMVHVTSPLAWTALGTALIILGGCLGWSVFAASYRTTVSGQGLLVPADGAFVSVHAPKIGLDRELPPARRHREEGRSPRPAQRARGRRRLADVDGRVNQLAAQRAALAERLDDQIGKETAAGAAQARGPAGDDRARRGAAARAGGAAGASRAAAREGPDAVRPGDRGPRADVRGTGIDLARPHRPSLARGHAPRPPTPVRPGPRRDGPPDPRCRGAARPGASRRAPRDHHRGARADGIVTTNETATRPSSRPDRS